MSETSEPSPGDLIEVWVITYRDPFGYRVTQFWPHEQAAQDRRKVLEAMGCEILSCRPRMVPW